MKCRKQIMKIADKILRNYHLHPNGDHVNPGYTCLRDELETETDDSVIAQFMTCRYKH